MLQINTPSSSSDQHPHHRFGSSPQLLSATPGLPTTQAKEQATKLLDCARYLNHTGVMLGDHRRVAASHYLNMMVRALFDGLEDGLPHSRSQADR